MEIIYKRSLEGKILQWSAHVMLGAAGVNIIMTAGELGGKLTRTMRPNILGKNVGKKNETTPEQQAQKVVSTLYRNQKTKGYKSLLDLGIEHNYTEECDLLLVLNEAFPIKATDANGILKPMKCQQYYRSKKDWTDPTGKVWADRKYYYLANPHVEKEAKAVVTTFPCIAQPKINGVRAFMFIDAYDKIRLLSKEGFDYDLPHIKQWIPQIKERLETFKSSKLVLDGELYIPGESLQVISSAVKAQNLNTPRIEFWVFDLAIDNMNNKERINLLEATVPDDSNSPVKPLLHHKCDSDKEAQVLADMFIKDGAEGAVFRSPNVNYQFGKRPMTMTKLKRILDDEFLIIGVTAQDKNVDRGLFVCETKNGRETFKTIPYGGIAMQIDAMSNPDKYIGKMLTIKFYEYTDSMIPFHIIDNIVRDYE